MPGNKLFSRTAQIELIDESKVWDLLVIGGGATGLGVAFDAATRGLKTILFEQFDFSKGTSSRSTKLIHGGVRYLAQGDIKLVYSALREREILTKNASHVVRKQSFIIPCYSVWQVLKYSIGLKLYDLLAGSFGLGRSGFVSRKKVAERMKNVKMKGLIGGVEYFDGQFDDSRLAINLAQSAIEHDAVVLNYFKVVNLVRDGQKLSGAIVKDVIYGREYKIKAKVVVNATGVFVDDILRMDDPGSRKTVQPSQGIHVVVDKKFLPGNSALLVPKTSDGRVLFAVPWHNHIVVGTTDTPLEDSSIEPVAMEAEIKFIFETISQYLAAPPSRSDVLSVFAGLRPLAAPSEKSSSTKELSRDHKLFTSPSGLITITGGKWTTYRKMAEDTVDLAITNAGLPKTSSQTKSTAIHGLRPGGDGRITTYGTDEEMIMQLIGEHPTLGEKLVNGHGYTLAEVVWAVRNEMAITIEDVLARRLRLLFIDANAAIKAAEQVADILMEELGWDEGQRQKQLEEFYKIAYHYRLN